MVLISNCENLVPSETFNLSWVNCEMASFIHMRKSAKHFIDRYNDGMIMQTLDVLDFSMLHLSAYERSKYVYLSSLFRLSRPWTDRSKRYKKQLWKGKEGNVHASDVSPVKTVADELEKKFNPKLGAKEQKYSEEAKRYSALVSALLPMTGGGYRTVVVMPFLGGAMGSGHSDLGNRFVYLKACFWSIYEFIPNIVIGVSRQEDVNWGWYELLAPCVGKQCL